MKTQANGGSQSPTMTMVRNVYRACAHCCAPGEYRCEVRIRDGDPEHKIAEMIHLHPELAEKAHFFRAGWPKVWVPMNDPRFGQPVGTKCPQCGERRDKKPERLPVLKIFGRLF